MRGLTDLPLVLKGVLTAEDAALAIEHGVDAIVVSNHGGRQLDGAVPSLAALPEVVAAIGGRCPVLLDGGVRSGRDIFMALALGASAVLLGRPALWALADGWPGWRRAPALHAHGRVGAHHGPGRPAANRATSTGAHCGRGTSELARACTSR